MEPIKLINIVDQWIALDPKLLQYRVGEMPFGWGVDNLKFVECRICWHNMGWIGSDRIFSNAAILEASDPSFFPNLKQYLIKHTKKCKIQR